MRTLQIKLHAILHGAYDHLTRPPGDSPLCRVIATPQKIEALSTVINHLIGTPSEGPLRELLREITSNNPQAQSTDFL